MSLSFKPRQILSSVLDPINWIPITVAHASFRMSFGLMCPAIHPAQWSTVQRQAVSDTVADPSHDVLQTQSPRSDLTEFMRNETRFRIVEHQDPERFRELAAVAQRQNAYRMALYQQLATLVPPRDATSGHLQYSV